MKLRPRKLGRTNFFFFTRHLFRKAVELMIEWILSKFYKITSRICCKQIINFKIRRKCWLMNLDSTILEIKDLQVSINDNEILKI
jgi:hypothetical protein